MKTKYILVGASIIGLVLIGLGVYNYLDNYNQGEKQLSFLLSIGGKDEGLLKRPSFVALNENGKVFVSDTGNSRVAVFSENGRFLYDFGNLGPKEQKLISPYGIGVLDDTIIVADPVSGSIFEYESGGEFKGKWIAEKPMKPVGIFVDKQVVYVTDTLSKQILLFNKKGQFLSRISLANSRIGSPLGIVVDAKGTIWVTDGENFNVKNITDTGKLITMFDGGPKRTLSSAKGIAVDRQGIVYVADTLAGVVRNFDEYGNDVSLFSLNDDKRKVLQFPYGIFVRDDKVYVTDQGLNKIQVWRWE